MFFRLHVLSRKGSLGTVWIAAHLDKKLKRQQISDTNIHQIMNPEVPFALRLSGQLLFGLVRVYQRQVSYLLQDCTDALSKLSNACLRSTSHEMNLPGTLKNLTISEDCFQLDAKEMDQLYGLLADHQTIGIEDESLVQAIDPPIMDSERRLSYTGRRGMSYGNRLEAEEREMIPFLDIPSEEIQREVIREQSNLDQHRLSFIPESVTEQESGRGEYGKSFRDDMEIDTSLKSPSAIPAVGEVMELREEEHIQPPPQTPCPLPEIRIDDLAPYGDQNLPPIPEIEDFETETVVPVIAVEKQLHKKHRFVIDKKTTVMSHSEYRKMQKASKSIILRQRKSAENLGKEHHTIDRPWERCSVCQVGLSPAMSDLWEETLRVDMTAKLGNQEKNESELRFDIERSKNADAQDVNADRAPFPSPRDQAESRSWLSTGSGIEMATSEFRPDTDKEQFHDGAFLEPAGDDTCMPEQSTAPLPETDDNFTRESQRILTYLKERLSMHTVVDDEILSEDDGTTSIQTMESIGGMCRSGTRAQKAIHRRQQS